jgi:glycosyltransferase involved in cell wall biosynthesis
VSALDAAHVGIMPLEDIPYNRGKCGFKLIQYMARAIPVVASPYGANAEIVRNGIDGLHATSHDEWVSALMTLASDRDARLAMGAEARKRIELHYSVEAVAPLYRQVIRSVAR